MDKLDERLDNMLPSMTPLQLQITLHYVKAAVLHHLYYHNFWTRVQASHSAPASQHGSNTDASPVKSQLGNTPTKASTSQPASQPSPHGGLRQDNLFYYSPPAPKVSALPALCDKILAAIKRSMLPEPTHYRHTKLSVLARLIGVQQAAKAVTAVQTGAIKSSTKHLHLFNLPTTLPELSASGTTTDPSNEVSVLQHLLVVDGVADVVMPWYMW